MSLRVGTLRRYGTEQHGQDTPSTLRGLVALDARLEALRIECLGRSASRSQIDGRPNEKASDGTRSTRRPAR
ncbi:hypothetical protein JCM10212_004648 [Sporobolomyces blumeae]